MNLLNDSLAGLERILTTPVPFSYVLLEYSSRRGESHQHFRYSIHLWAVTFIYCLSLVRLLKPDIATRSLTLLVCSLCKSSSPWAGRLYLQQPSQYVETLLEHNQSPYQPFALQCFIFFGFLVAGEEIESTPSASAFLFSHSHFSRSIWLR